MKKIIRMSVALIMAIVFTLSLVSCNTVDKEGLWEEATYLKDMEFGDGATAITVEVVAGEQKVTFTVNTDKKILSDALLEHEIIKAETGPYGLYVTHVNGILASDEDKAYWAIYVNGEYGQKGISETDVTAGTVYKLEYTTY